LPSKAQNLYLIKPAEEHQRPSIWLSCSLTTTCSWAVFNRRSERRSNRSSFHFIILPSDKWLYQAQFQNLLNR